VRAFGLVFRKPYFGQDHIQSVVKQDWSEIMVKVAVEPTQPHDCTRYSKRSAFGRYRISPSMKRRFKAGINSVFAFFVRFSTRMTKSA
jgi:hypothetical protein